jgi:hypothetical protein
VKLIILCTAARSTPLGMYFNARKRKGRFFEMMHNWPSANVQVHRSHVTWKQATSSCS